MTSSPPESGPPEEPGPPRVSPLVAALVQASYDQYASTARSLISSYARQVAGLEAQRDLIREGIARLLAGPYAPSESSIARALYPSAKAVDARTAEYLAGSDG